jgi:ABC-2 type transport system permease protein
MNTRSNAVSDPHFESRVVAPAVISEGRRLYWSVQREMWENRSTYIAPLAAAAIFLFGFMISVIRMRRHIAASLLDPIQVHDQLTSRYELSAALIMGTALIVGIFYALDALYGERRDRSILFWKSLPVSDLTTVLSKFAIPIVVLPVLSFAITLGTQFLMLVISSAMLAGSGVDVATLWTHESFLRISLVILYHFLTVHGLWYAPLYGWLLLVSAWAPRAPFIWAFLPPFVISGVEKIAFNTSYFLRFLQYRLLGPGGGMTPDDHAHDFMASLIPHHFLSTPGLWTGLAVAALFLLATVQLRRSRGPI